MWLINVDAAARCRRCGQAFSKVDRAAESERIVASMRLWKASVVAIGVLLVVGLVAGGLLYKSRLDRLSEYNEHARLVETDLVTLRRGAAADAALIARAFDDNEVRRILRDQSGAWLDRVERCKALGQQVDELVPQSAEQTSHEVGIERDLAALTSASRGLAEAAANQDPFSAKMAAATIATPDDADGSK